ncbi:MAG: hypothetical protein RL322_2120 [Pseudomonadota bacterium]
METQSGIAQRGGPSNNRVLLLGATGTMGVAVRRVLLDMGYEVICPVRAGRSPPIERPGLIIRPGDLLDPVSWSRDLIRGETFDAVISCLASRTGAALDAWAIDYQAHVHALEAVQAAGVRHMVLLSAICVQKPRLQFQRAKLAFEQRLIESGLAYSIVRPTAFFKSLSGQVERVRAGKPFLMFGDGRLTACKPISDDDLARFLVECLDDPDRKNRILPIGGPGPAITPLEQGERLFELFGNRPRFRRVPVAVLDVIVGTLDILGRVLPSAAARAERARIGQYYATESMLVWDPVAKRYDAEATPSTGTETLWDHYQDLVSGARTHQRSEHSVF